MITFQTGRYYDCIRLHNAFRRIPGLVTERRKNCTDVLPFSPFSTKNETPSPCYLPYTIRIYVFPSTIRLDRHFPLFLFFFVFTDKLGPRLIIESNKNSTRNTHTHTHTNARISRGTIKQEYFRNSDVRPTFLESAQFLSFLSDVRSV